MKYTFARVMMSVVLYGSLISILDTIWQWLRG